ncbi:hypothetical protein GCM10011309_24340 [Litorimonas cladophorae]|uniref:N-acetyltransferase domain-containing protein n=1 Tax=Litorimonas cladophorae TaxID=1220491 RepID=A0A918KRQ4_9PROT|nr:GNAT family N-acetyltransferase [Litorimonas cladophorae]GGX73427.1 hypothetical protein GCM10011309_24340 [Litorimonas cladophorae]
MSSQSYIIDTNIIIGLEDNHTVKPAYSTFSSLAAKHKIDVLVHEAARDDINRDKNVIRRNISLSKLEKFQEIGKVKGLTKVDLEKEYGPLSKHNDVVDARLLNAVKIGAADFLVTQDQGLHDRAQKHSTDLSRRVLFVADAAQLLQSTYEPKEVPIRNVADVSAHTINVEDTFFDSLRDGYGRETFNQWWKDKCVKGRRPCWVVYDNDQLAGLIVRKDESGDDTDASQKLKRILKICTFKVCPEKRGVKLGELLLKQAFWYAQSNDYDLAYLTTYAEQDALINLLEYYGFEHTSTKGDGELIYERRFSNAKLATSEGQNVFDADRLNYPRFVTTDNVRAFGIPIKEDYHDILYPDLRNAVQSDLFKDAAENGVMKRPGNTIRKVYLCRAPSKLAEPGSILFFYKSKSSEPPSQAMTAVAILEEVALANSTKELMQLTGGRSVYSESELQGWRADEKPVKVINYLLVGYIDPPIELQELRERKVVTGKNPPQSIYELRGEKLTSLLQRINLGFEV